MNTETKDYGTIDRDLKGMIVQDAVVDLLIKEHGQDWLDRRQIYNLHTIKRDLLEVMVEFSIRKVGDGDFPANGRVNTARFLQTVVEVKQPVITKLTTRYKEDLGLLTKISEFCEKLNGHHPRLNIGDTIQFWAGYNNDIRYESEIVGIDDDGEIYVIWDCYWSPIRDEVRRLIEVVKPAGEEVVILKPVEEIISGFVNSMRWELEENKHKGDWRQWTNKAEIRDELTVHLEKLDIARELEEVDKIQEHIADCADILMMLGNAYKLY